MINRNILRSVIREQQPINLPEPCIERQVAFDMQTLRQTDAIVIVTGIRRCGKSTWLQQLRLAQQEKHYYLNFDDDRLVEFELADFQVLLELLIELYGEQHTFYFDEIQTIVGWERFVRRLHDQKNKIYITGSNATMFGRELGTHVTGRYIKYEMFPFSFTEFMVYQGYVYDPATMTTEETARLNRYFREYSHTEGFAEYMKNAQLGYLQGLYESVLYRNIIVRYKLNADRAIEALMYYLASNVGKMITYNSLKNMLGAASANTVSDYCGYLQNGYLSFLVNRFDRSLKKQSFSPKRVYCIDTGLARAIGFCQSDDHGPLLKNIVFLQLMRRGYVIYYHKDKYECDFIAQKFNQTQYAIQVCYDVKEEKTREREIRGLRDALANHQLERGYIITADHEECFENIQFVPITRWLIAGEGEFEYH